MIRDVYPFQMKETSLNRDRNAFCVFRGRMSGMREAQFKVSMPAGAEVQREQITEA
jgi:hypothetical protein